MPEWIRTVALLIAGSYFLVGGVIFYMWKVGKVAYGLTKVEYRSDMLSEIERWKTRTKVFHFVLFAVSLIIGFHILDG